MVKENNKYFRFFPVYAIIKKTTKKIKTDLFNSPTRQNLLSEANLVVEDLNKTPLRKCTGSTLRI